LIWDERFVKHLKEVEPADYTAVKPQKVSWVEHDDVKEASSVLHTGHRTSLLTGSPIAELRQPHLE